MSGPPPQLSSNPARLATRQQVSPELTEQEELLQFRSRFLVGSSDENDEGGFGGLEKRGRKDFVVSWNAPDHHRVPRTGLRLTEDIAVVQDEKLRFEMTTVGLTKGYILLCGYLERLISLHLGHRLYTTKGSSFHPS